MYIIIMGGKRMMKSWGSAAASAVNIPTFPASLTFQAAYEGKMN
jgi:hypothetical protein